VTSVGAAFSSSVISLPSDLTRSVDK
jgi:hypothetical protein